MRGFLTGWSIDFLHTASGEGVIMYRFVLEVGNNCVKIGVGGGGGNNKVQITVD